MSRKLCCICLALSVFISTVSIAYADSTSITHPTAEDYRQAVAYLETAGLQTGFDSARTSTQRLYSADLPAGGQDASVTQLQFMALDEMEAELQAQQAAREQVADNLALLAQYDGVMLNSDTTVYSDAGVTASGNVIEGDKVAKLKDIDESGSWYYVSFSDFSGYVSADACTPVDYAEYDDTDAVRTQAEIDALAKTSYAATFGSGVVSGGSTLRSAIVDYAYSFLGTPYVYGGASPSGFDCSGFTMYVYNQLGISLPHGATPQLKYGTYVSRSELQPGDLVFFSDGSYPASHVGIYVGDDQFIHASSSYYNGHCVVITSLSETYYNNHYLTARRH
mgnify:CR=1 FL=1